MFDPVRSVVPEDGRFRCVFVCSSSLDYRDIEEQIQRWIDGKRSERFWEPRLTSQQDKEKRPQSADEFVKTLERSIADLYDAVHEQDKGVTYRILTDETTVSGLLALLTDFKKRCGEENLAFGTLCDRLATIAKVLKISG